MSTGKGGWTYITTTRKNTVLYTGVTSELRNRIYKHTMKQYPRSFTARYNADKLVWFEFYELIVSAIEREKQIKGWLRKKKVALIDAMNPEWIDLYDGLD